MLGMLGIANRKGGYKTEIVQALSPLLVTAGSIIHSMRSLTKSMEIESELKDRNDLLNGAIHNITDALIITDHQGYILETNRPTELMFGYHMQELLGRNIALFLSEDSKTRYADQLKSFLISGNREIIQDRTEMVGIGKNKRKLPIDLAMNDIKLGNKKLFVNILQDITQRKSQENKIEQANRKLRALSETDELTGLYNRRYFDNTFKKEFNRSRKLDCNLALAIIDIDHFKAYNDSYGHLCGDQCLARLGKILKGYFKRDCEFVARIGGEEFAVVMTHMSESECIEALEGLLARVNGEKIEHAYSVAPHLSLSVGLTICDSKTENTSLAYKKADAALYRAKDNGRNQLVVSAGE
jgi:diguanylate cyclase (GGDEF)-like protein/PAS domain S-box-containing protein